MPEKTRMVHIRMPISLIKELDYIIKSSPNNISRSGFIVRATAERIKRERYLRAIRGLSEMLRAEDVPHWADEKAVDAWLEANRRADVESFREKWQE